MNNTEKYFENDPLAYDAWKSKYQLNGETLDEFFIRIASEFARLDNFKINESLDSDRYFNLSPYGKSRLSENRYESFLNLFKDFQYIIPGGSVLAGVGGKKPVSLSNCFVLNAEDNIGSIFAAGSNMAQIYKRRGGVGVDLSSLRPRNASVNNAANTTSGIVPFMDLYSQVTNTIGQEGRRGALMLSVDINHPDSPEFITSKQNLTKITGANISVKLDNEFKLSVEAGVDYYLRWPCNCDFNIKAIKDHFEGAYLVGEIKSPEIEYDKLYSIVRHTSMETSETIYFKKIDAQKLWDSIIECAWNTAEPGILFWDNIINNDPASVYPEFKAVSTNPCGEIPLSPYDSCRLIATNLFSLVDDPFTELAHIDYKLAHEVFYEAQIIADILVDLEAEYVQRIIDKTEGAEQELWKKIKEIGLKGRRTGTGLTGLGDMFAAINLPYGNEHVLDKLMHTKMNAELNASIDLAIVNGAFPAYNVDLEFPFDEFSKLYGNNFYHFLQLNFQEQVHKMRKYGRRNISWSTIAPTGTISIMAGVTSGGEPLYDYYYRRRRKCNPGEVADFTDQNGIGFMEYNVIHPKFRQWVETPGNCLGAESGDLITPLDNMSTDELDILVKRSPWYHQIAAEINPSVRIKTQSILQTYTTHSISSTINLAESATREDIDFLYKEAWNSNLKGVTVYRDNCRTGILLKAEAPKPIIDDRPAEIECKVEHFKNEKKDWIAFVGLLNNQPYEIFTGPKDLDVFPIPSSVLSGQIIKVRQEDGDSRYDFRYVDSYGYTNTLGGLSRVFDKEHWNYGRLLSALLRQNMEIVKLVKVVEGLIFSNKGMNTWKAGVIRALKTFIPDGTQVHGEICENCGGNNVIYNNGCKECRDCGSSKCG
jgi:ribonucleoside-diphosphate reductase alpha chain